MWLQMHPQNSIRYRYPPISFNSSLRTILDWLKSNIVMRFFATTPAATISSYPCLGGHNIPCYGTHVANSLCDVLHLFFKPSPTPLHLYYGSYLYLCSKTSKWQSVRTPWILIHVNNLQNKFFIPPLSSPYALCITRLLHLQASVAFSNDQSVELASLFPP